MCLLISQQWLTSFSVGKPILQSHATEPNGPGLSDGRKLHDTGRRYTADNPSEQDSTESHDTETIGDEPVELTGVGHVIAERGVMRIIDDAHWKPQVRPDANRSFALLISMIGSKRQLFVKSPFLVLLLEDVIERTGIMGMTKGSEGISILEPYVPLYWSYSHIIHSGSEADHPSQQDIKDLQSLRYWYERWVLPSHNQIRETIHSGVIAFSDLWALFRPGETVYTEDEFEQPELSIVIGTRYEAPSTPTTGHTRPHPVGQPKPSSFNMESWYQAWDPLRHAFVKGLTVTSIMPFDGSLRITDLEVYPVRFFGEGDESQIENLDRKLEHRGRRWKELFGPSVQHLYHEGPATIEKSGLFKNRGMYGETSYDRLGKVHVRHDATRRMRHLRLTIMPISFHRES